MKPFPIRATRDYYRGRDERKQHKAVEYNRVVDRVEKYINERLADLPEDTIQQFFSANIAIDLQEDPAVVQRIVFSIDCGHNGVTCYRGDAQAAMDGGF